MKDGDNLVTYYMLPLVSVNKKVFGLRFKNSYINQDGDKIYVKLSSPMTSVGYKKVRSYVAELIIKDQLYVVYKVPQEFFSDGQKFVAGKYSSFSRKAKKTIYSGSGLPYNQGMGDFKMSSPVLQALDKTKVLRRFLTTYLGVKEIPIVVN